MKTFNEIVAPRASTITAIVEDGQPGNMARPFWSSSEASPPMFDKILIANREYLRIPQGVH